MKAWWRGVALVAIGVSTGCQRTPSLADGPIVRGLESPPAATWMSASPVSTTDAVSTPAGIELPAVITEPVAATLGPWGTVNDAVPLTATKPTVESSRRWHPVYFGYNQSLIGSSERQKLERLASYLNESPHYKLTIEGHCDERGSAEYNRALGERRALSARDYLVSLGVAEDRLETISYGEERPVESGATAMAYSQNRRAEFVVFTK